MLGEDHFFRGMDNGAEDTAGLTAEFGKGGFHLCEKYILFGVGQALPAHTDYQMRHGEPEEDEAEEGGECSAGRDDPESGQERKRLGSEAFAGGGDKRRDGIPCRKPASKTLGACGINNGREEHPKLRDDRDAAPHITIEAGQWSERQADGETSE